MLPTRDTRWRRHLPEDHKPRIPSGCQHTNGRRSAYGALNGSSFQVSCLLHLTGHPARPECRTRETEERRIVFGAIEPGLLLAIPRTTAGRREPAAASRIGRWLDSTQCSPSASARRISHDAPKRERQRVGALPPKSTAHSYFMLWNWDCTYGTPRRQAVSNPRNRFRFPKVMYNPRADTEAAHAHDGASRHPM